jgi:enediyne biosynthesis protein E4
MVFATDGSPAVRFVDVTASSGLALTGYGLGAATGDFDNDGFVDLYLTDFGPNRLLRNGGDGTFADVTRARGTGDSRWTAAATFFDFDLDGWLDLFVGNYIDFSFANHQPCFRPSSALDYCGPMSYRPQPDALWRNRGDGSFEDATAAAGMVGPLGNTLGVIALDVDDDGRPDLAVANDAMENFLWHNVGNGMFSEEGLQRGIAVNQAGQREGSMGITAGDFDHDGDEDLFITHMATETNTLYVNQGDGVFLDRSLPAGLAAPSRAATAFGTSWIDYDNDGWQDLMAVNGEVKVIEALERAGDGFPLHQKNQLFRNLGDGTFREVSSAAGAAFEASEVSRGALFGDLDNDGDTDVVIANDNGPARVLINELGSVASWLGFRAVIGASPRTVSGTRLEVRGGDDGVLMRTIRSDGSYLSASDPRALFGLGARDVRREVRIDWPGGPHQLLRDLTPRRYLTLRGSARPVTAAR